jgi:hypothetical protein
MTREHNDHILLGFAVAGALFAWITCSVVVWNIVSIKKDIASLEKESAAVEVRNRNARAIVRALERTSKLRESMRAYIVSGDDDVLAFIDNIELIASQTGVSASFHSLRGQEREGNEALFSEVTIKGSWEHVMMFITRIENYPGNIDITRVNMQYVEEGDREIAGSHWKADIEYFLKSYEE